MEPKALEMMQAMLFVLCDEEKKSDALFLHGRGDLVEEGLTLAYDLFRRGLTPKIVINGLTAEKCKELNLDYAGHEGWIDILEKIGARREDVLLLPPSNHTGEESENLVSMAKEQGWKTLTIVAAPYHQLRCFLQIIAAILKSDVDLDVYNQTLHNVNWDKHVTKILMGGGAITGTRLDQIAGEYERILKYTKWGDIRFTRHATISEMLAYMEQRNKRNRGV